MASGKVLAGDVPDSKLTAVEIKANMTSGGNAAFHNFNNDFAHVADPTERRRLALAEIDRAPFGWYHIRTIMIAGIGFFTDSYDIFAIGLVTSMLGIVYYGGNITSEADTAIKVATSSGTVVGQLAFGMISDLFGRKRIYGFELIIIISTTLAQALSAQSVAVSMTGLLVFWRIVMGIGIGGDYPLSATITSEFATTKWRGFMINAVFAMQGMGQLGAALMLLIVTAGFKDGLSTSTKASACTTNYACVSAVDKMWRIIVGAGAVPACVALYFRLTIPETPRYTFDVDKTLKQVAADIEAARNIAPVESEPEPEQASWKEFSRHYGKWKNLKVLLGTALSWCFLDIAFYGLGLNNPIILNAIGWSGGADMYQVFHKTAVGNLILVLAGAVPGYWVSAGLIDTVGRKPIQLFGFFMLTLIFLIIGCAFWSLSGSALLGLYTLAQFFFNAGPNSTTFVIPAEIFPTKYRSTSHGISAASGKVGAIIAQVVFGPLKGIGADATLAKTDPRWSTPWLPHIMQIFAAIMALGFCSSWLIPETKRKTLEELGAMGSDSDDESVAASPVLPPVAEADEKTRDSA